MVVIKGIMDVHLFDGSGRGLFALAEGPNGEFRFPISQEQAAMIIGELGDVQGHPEDEDEDGDLEAGSGNHSIAGVAEFDSSRSYSRFTEDDDL